MADFNPDLRGDGLAFQEVTGFEFGDTLTTQNKAGEAWIWYGPTPPANLQDGVHLGRDNFNGALHEGVLETKLFWRGTRLHVSKGS